MNKELEEKMDLEGIEIGEEELQQDRYKKEIEDLKRLNLAFEKGLDRRCAEFAVFHAEKEIKGCGYETEKETEEAFKEALIKVIKENSFLKGSGQKRTGLKQTGAIDEKGELRQVLGKAMGIRM